MDKDQEILAISRLAFELTKVGSAGSNLDRLLAELFKLLSSLNGIRVLPHSAILLNTPHGRLIQVAQFGLEPAWNRSYTAPEPPVAIAQDNPETAYLSMIGAHLPALSAGDFELDTPCFALPLNDDDRRLGLAIFLIDPDWYPDSIEIEFMSDLSRTVSMLVARSLTNETLRVREVELEEARADAIRRLGTASEYRDNETGMHVMRMTHFATAIAKAMGLPDEDRELLTICAPMHDVGKIGISDAILLKPARLTVEEFEVMKSHTEIGSRLLAGDDKLSTAAREIAACHHERWDGQGYPSGLAGEDIPILARICSLADVFDALTSTRPYKHPWPVDEAIAFVYEQSGCQFDPAVVAGFKEALPEIARIRELYRDDIINPQQTVTLPDTLYSEAHWIRWDETLSVGIDVIDEHHRYLFDLTNDLFEVVASQRGVRDVARILKALDQYARVHFRAEERMMAHYAYGELARQEHQHRNFEEKLKEFYEELHENPLTAPFDALIYLRDWLVKHIKIEDAQLKVLITPERPQDMPAYA